METDPGAISLLVQAAVAAFSVLAGVMMLYGGSDGSGAIEDGAPQHEVADKFNVGMARSFVSAAWWALFTFAIVLFVR